MLGLNHLLISILNRLHGTAVLIELFALKIFNSYIGGGYCCVHGTLSRHIYFCLERLLVDLRNVLVVDQEGLDFLLYKRLHRVFHPFR